jgi:hypothetical protein
MDKTQLTDALRDLSLSKPELARLIGVTARAVNLWSSGERDIPGPAIAYLRLLQSLPKALRTQELARINQENHMKYDGMYAVEFVGRTGDGICALVMMDGCVFGHDGGVHYDGTYEPNQSDPGKMDLSLNLTVPAGVALVQGVPAQPAEYRFPLSVSIPARGVTQQNISTPYGPVQCKIRYLRPIPAQLTA